MSYKKIIFNKLTLVALVVSVIYQIAMIGIYIGGYRYTADRMDQSNIIYVNQDGDAGDEIVESIQESLDFKHQDVSDLTEAKEFLENHKAALIINVPKNYAEDLAVGKSVALNYFYNSSGDTISRQTGTTLASSLTNKLNLAVSKKKMQVVLIKSMMTVAKPQIEADIKAAVGTNISQAEAVTKTVTEKYQTQFAETAKQAVDLNSVSENSKDINPKSTSKLNLIMTPMIAPVSSYIAAMISSIILYSFVFKKAVRSHVSRKWKAWAVYELNYLIISLATGLTGTLMLAWVNGFNQEITLKLFGILSLNTFVSFQLIAAVYMVLGALAILVTLPLTLAQVVASGTMMPEYLMAPALKAIRPYLPVSSSWQLIQDTIFKSNIDGAPVKQLVLIGVVSLSVVLVALPIRYRKDDSEVPDIDVLSFM